MICVADAEGCSGCKFQPTRCANLVSSIYKKSGASHSSATHLRSLTSDLRRVNRKIRPYQKQRPHPTRRSGAVFRVGAVGDPLVADFILVHRSVLEVVNVMSP